MATKAETPMPPANADLQTTWAYLEEGVDHIMTRLRDGISYSKYMNLYTVAYNYCVSSRMHGNLDSSVGLGGRSESRLWSRRLATGSASCLKEGRLTD
jgi:cullin 1